MFYKFLTVVLLATNICFGYMLHTANTDNEQLLITIKQQDKKIKDYENMSEVINKQLEEVNKDLETLKKELMVADTHIVEYTKSVADAEHKEAEKHLGESFYYVDVKCTAYSAGDNHTPGTTMANGEEVRVGAVAYNDVPLGTKIEIDGAVYTVCDRVGSDGVVDIYMDTIDECFDFGVQYKTIKVYNE